MNICNELNILGPEEELLLINIVLHEELFLHPYRVQTLSPVLSHQLASPSPTITRTAPPSRPAPRGT